MSKDAAKPVNLRADVLPTEGFILSVDGKLKKRYDTADIAMAEGAKLKQSYPMIQVAIYHAAERRYVPVEGDNSTAAEE